MKRLISICSKPVLFRGQCFQFLVCAVIYCFSCLPNVHAQQAQQGLVPVSQQPHTDKLGNEWYVEQNGQIGRHSSGNSMLSQAMTLMVGQENFYCNQPMGTPDGRELVLMGSQPTQGLQVTRRVRYLDKEGGLLYLDSFMNPGAMDVNTSIELRQNFNNNYKSLLSDSMRPVRGTLEKDESGFVVVPTALNQNAYAFIVCAPRSQIKPRITTPGTYQVSVIFAVTVPAGKSVSIMHAVTQGKLSPRPDAKELEKMFKPFALGRLLRELPKNSAPQIVNLRGASTGALDLSSWFPEEFFGVKREASDLLAMGEGTRLRGKASCAKLALDHRLGKIIVPWEDVAAIAGGRREGLGQSRIFLNDGQILRGPAQAAELRFELSGGLKMDLKISDVDVLVTGSAGGAAQWPQGVAALAEMMNSERIALRDISALEFPLVTAWGARQAKLAEIAWLSQSADESSPGALAQFTDGSRLRAWFGAGNVAWPTVLFGKQNWSASLVRTLACAAKLEGDANASGNEDPAQPYVDLAGDQRLMARPSDAMLHFVTAGGLVPLDPGSIKDLRNVTEEIPGAVEDDAPWFQAQLWGGGAVLGQLRESAVHFSVGGATWTVPVREITRIANPVPKIADATLVRIGSLIRELGHDEWRKREKAGAELKSLGEMAKTALQEALKQTEDPEVKRRIEGILGDLE